MPLCGAIVLKAIDFMSS